MTRIIEEVAVKIDADTRGLNKGMKESKKKVGALTSQFKKLGGVLAATFGARAVFRGFQQTLRLSDQLIKTAKGVGFTVNEYQRLIFALDQVGVSAGSAKIALGDFQKRLSKAVAGTSPQFKKAFTDAGLDVDALSKMAPAAAFQAAIAHLATMRDDPRLPGFVGNVLEEQSGKDFLKVIRQMPKYVDSLDKFDKSVGKLSKRQTADIEKLAESIRLYGQSWDVLKMQIVADAAPKINAALKDIVDGGGLDLFASVFENIAENVGTIVEGVSSLADMIDKLPIPDWLTQEGGPITAIRNKAANIVGLDHAPTSIFDAANMITSGPPDLSAWTQGTNAGGGAGANVTNNYTVKATGRNEISEAEARNIRKQFDKMKRAQ
jgi:hypothetical protein